MSLDDGILRMFIDQVFQAYDFDRSGTLQIEQLHTFFNQLFIGLNEPTRFTSQQTKQFVKGIDFQNNGRINKPELFLLFKTLTSGPGLQAYGNNKPNQYGQPPQNYGPPPQQYGQQYSQPPYGQQGMYGQPGQYGQQQGQQGQYGPGPQQPMYFATNQNNPLNQYKK